MAQNESKDPFKRILKASNRDHLDTPFRTHDALRKKHFPGAGSKLSHSRLEKAYLTEASSPTPDWKLLAHGTWPWVIGHAHDLESLRGELESAVKTGEKPAEATQRKRFIEQFSEAGTQEIETFLRIFANGGKEFQKAILEKLESAPRPEQATVPVPVIDRDLSGPDAPTRPTVDDLDPITRAKMSLIGTAFLLALSLLPLGIQFWRQPDQDHWIVVGLTGILALLTLVFVVDYARKKP